MKSMNNIQPSYQVALNLMQEYLLDSFPRKFFIKTKDKSMPWENDDKIDLTYKQAWDSYNKFLIDDYETYRKIIEKICADENLVNLFSENENGYSCCSIGYDENHSYLISCSDIFELACADAEVFDDKDVPLLSAIKTVFGWMGLMVWIGIKRNYDPVFYKINKEEYFETKKTVDYVYKLYYTLDENFFATDDDVILAELDDLWMKSDKNRVAEINQLLPQPNKGIL